MEAHFLARAAIRASSCRLLQILNQPWGPEQFRSSLLSLARKAGIKESVTVPRAASVSRGAESGS